MDNQDKAEFLERLKIEQQFKNGADWFFWIAGLSLVNSLIILFGGNTNFIVGLGITQIFDGIGLEIAKEAGMIGILIALALDVIATGIFVMFGVFARKGHDWAFIVGMINPGNVLGEET
jgi:hypothetical protein